MEDGVISDDFTECQRTEMICFPGVFAKSKEMYTKEKSGTKSKKVKKKYKASFLGRDTHPIRSELLSKVKNNDTSILRY